MASVANALNWDDFRIIAVIAETQSLPGAAATLGIDHSTVFRRLNQIEATLGVKLFIRSRAGYAPTAAGEEIIAIATKMDEDINALARRLKGREPEPSGELRLTTNDSLLIYLLTPMLARFRQRYPRIRVDIVVGNRALNLTKRDSDVAIRATDHPPETLVGRRLARITWALYGRRADFPSDSPVDPEHLAHRDWVGLGESLAGIAAVRHLREAIAPDRQALTIDTVLGLSEAIEAGLGIGHLPCFVGDLRAGLRRLGPRIDAFATDLWLLTHADLRHAARIRAFLDHMAEEIAACRGLIEGETPIPLVAGD